MVTSLHDDCSRLNERQDRILLLFGKLVNSKYQISRPEPTHSNDRYADAVTSTYTNGGRIAGKQEVYYDTKWRPLVEAHQRLIEAVGGNGGNDINGVNVDRNDDNRGSNNRDDTRMNGGINGGIVNGISGRNKLSSSSSPLTPLLFNTTSSKIKNMPPSLSPLPSLSSISLAGNFPSLNPETLGCEYKLKRERRMLSSAVAKHLFFTASKGFGRVSRASSVSASTSKRGWEWEWEEEAGECYAAAKRAVDNLENPLQNRAKGLDFININKLIKKYRK